MKPRSLALTLLLLAVVLGASALAARAATQSVYHGGTYFGNVVVEPGEVVEGDLTVVFGNATIEGTVDGDVNVVGGDATIAPGAIVSGHVNTAGGSVVRDVIPWVPAAIARDAYHRHDGLLWHVWTDVIVLLVFLIFPLRARMTLDRLEHHPGFCAAVGLLGWVAVIPIALLLCITIILVPLVLLEIAALIAGVCIGTAAVALLIGRRLYEAVTPNVTPAPLGALLVGLILLTLAEMIPVLGTFVTILLALIGLGAAILAFVNEQAFAGATPRPQAGGPPMPAG